MALETPTVADQFSDLFGSRRGGGRPREDTLPFGRWQTELSALLIEARQLDASVFSATGVLTSDTALVLEACRVVVELDAQPVLANITRELSAAFADERAMTIATHAALSIICHGQLDDFDAEDLWRSWGHTLRRPYPFA